MDTEAAILKAILDQPNEDTPRLVYADWLDENATTGAECGKCLGSGSHSLNVYELSARYGAAAAVKIMNEAKCAKCDGSGRVSDGRKERAEFIRLQITIAGLQKDCLCGSCVSRRGGGQHHNGPCAVQKRGDDGVQHYYLKRQYELWESAGRWGEVDNRLFNTIYEAYPEQTPDGPYVVWRRGFADKVIGTRQMLCGEYECAKCRSYIGRGQVPLDNNVRNSAWIKCDWCGGTGYDDPADGIIDLYRTQPLTAVQFTDLTPSLNTYSREYTFCDVGYFPYEYDRSTLPHALWDVMDDEKFLANFNGRIHNQQICSSLNFPSSNKAMEAVHSAFFTYIRSLRTYDD
jgi:uncharacterized protein (TIGR02996 family)